jgi:hypothetical protein
MSSPVRRTVQGGCAARKLARRARPVNTFLLHSNKRRFLPENSGGLVFLAGLWYCSATPEGT